MAVDLAVKNGRIVNSTGTQRAGIAVDKGKIVAIAPDEHLPQAKRTVDAKGNYVIPGAIDPHVHLSVSFPFADDCRLESRAAALGGVTTMINFLGLGTTVYKGSAKDKEFFPKYRDLVEKNSYVDIGFSLIPNSNQQVDEMREYARELGISSFKFLLGWRGEVGRKIGVEVPDDARLYEVYETVREMGYPAIVQVHAENVEVAGYFEKRVKAAGGNDLVAFTEARPAMCCVQSTMTNLYYAKLTRSRLYIVHVSTGEEAELVKKAKAEGVDVIAETCPHYLVLDIVKDAKLGNLGKVSPPFKYKEDSERLWQAIKEGTVECLGSDNCPANRKIQTGTIWQIIGGLPLGTATMLPLMLSEGVNKGRITIEKLVEIACYNNARVFGMPQKGIIAIGADADLVVVDMNKEVTLSHKLFETLADYTPYDGFKIKGFPTTTIVRGNVVVENGQVVGSPGTGKYVPRPVA